MKQSQVINSTALLFPNYFKKIGILLILVSVAVAVAIKFLFPELEPAQKELYKIIFYNMLILGLFFAAWSRDKFEDEMTLQVRMKAISFTFMTAVFYVIVRPFADMVMNDAAVELGSRELMIFMLMMYILFYKLQKRAS